MRLFFIYCFHESGIKMVSSAKGCLRFILMNEKKKWKITKKMIRKPYKIYMLNVNSARHLDCPTVRRKKTIRNKLNSVKCVLYKAIKWWRTMCRRTCSTCGGFSTCHRNSYYCFFFHTEFCCFVPSLSKNSNRTIKNVALHSTTENELTRWCH